MLAETAANKRVIFGELWVWRSVLLSSRNVQQKLLLVGEWAKAPLSRHVVFLARSRREIVISSSSGHRWMGQRLSLAPINLSFRHAQFLLPVRSFWELLPFGIYPILFLFLLISTDFTIDRRILIKLSLCCRKDMRSYFVQSVNYVFIWFPKTFKRYRWMWKNIYLFK